ncbi:hypothetical protein F383_04533 [Gossypium arboreum]|uniref:Uncharacterized protein n=1 Tax=Gossypium arboreum TaxID=29729 RepID=A0A0B0PQP8_GOSAR|nr:hypothetical protein F383_04533 [Gossypium arboreum]
MFLYLGEHRRVKRGRNGPKIEKLDPHWENNTAWTSSHG